MLLRILKIVALVAAGIAFAAVVVFAIGLYKFVQYEDVEKGRLSNSAGTMDAVIAERETNATVATPMAVYVLPKGAKISGDPVFLADHVDGLQTAWSADTTLVIHAKVARVFPNSQKGSVAIKVNGENAVVKIESDISEMKR